MNEYIVGIDLGSSKVCGAVGKVDKIGGLQIVGITSVDCAGLKKGVVVDIDAVAESVQSCIEQLESMVDINISNAYISLPGGITELIWSKGVIAVSSEDSEITTNEIERVIKAAKIIKLPADKEIIGVIPEQYTVDGYSNIKDPRGMSGLRLEVDAQVIMAQTTVVNNLFKSINKAKTGLKVSGIILQPVALSSVVLKDEEKQMGTALIDVGADTIDISIYKGGFLKYVGMIPLGGSIITSDVALCLKIPVSQAEKLKLQYSSYNKATRESNEKIKVNDTYNNTIDVEISMLTEIIEARLEEIWHLINKKLKESGLYEDISGVVLVGGGLAPINNISEMGKSIILKPVRVGIPDYVGAANPIFAVVIGVVKNVFSSMKIVNHNDSQVDLISNKKNTKKEKEKEKEVYNDEDEEQVGLISKIKQFFTEFF